MAIPQSLMKTFKQCPNCCSAILESKSKHTCEPVGEKKEEHQVEHHNARINARLRLNLMYQDRLKSQPFALVPTDLNGNHKWYLAHISTEEWLDILKGSKVLKQDQIKQLLRLVMQDPRNWNVVLPRNQISIYPHVMMWQADHKWKKQSTLNAFKWLAEALLVSLCLAVPAKPWCMDVNDVTPSLHDPCFGQDLMVYWITTSREGWDVLMKNKVWQLRSPAPALLDQDKEAMTKLWQVCK